MPLHFTCLWKVGPSKWWSYRARPLCCSSLSVGWRVGMKTQEQNLPKTCSTMWRQSWGRSVHLMSWGCNSMTYLITIIIHTEIIFLPTKSTFFRKVCCCTNIFSWWGFTFWFVSSTAEPRWSHHLLRWVKPPHIWAGIQLWCQWEERRDSCHWLVLCSVVVT